MNDAGQKPSLEIELRLRDLPAEVKRSRELARQENERLELAARPRMEAQLHACKMALEQLKDWHRRVADTTDLQLTGYSRIGNLAPHWTLARPARRTDRSG